MTTTRSPDYVEIKKDLDYVRRHLRKIHGAAEGVTFTDEERELLGDSVGKLHVRIAELEQAIRSRAGETIDGEAA